MSLNLSAFYTFSTLNTPEFISKTSTSESIFDLPENKPCKGGKSQTAQGERSVTLGISPLNSHNDSHRVDSVSLETDGIVVAMTYPENHCIGEYAIPYRNAISVNAGLKQCCSMSYPGLRFAHPGLSRRNKMKTELFDSRRPVKGLVF